jgi:hypothetical protein
MNFLQEVLSAKLKAKKAALERRLQSVNQLSNDIDAQSLLSLNPPIQTRSSLSVDGAMTLRPVCFDG